MDQLDTLVPRAKATILLVDDDDVVRRAVRKTLERAGYAVFEAVNGVHALTTLGDVLVDVVITDTVMPEMDGRELARRIAVERPDIPLILMSGYTADKFLDVPVSGLVLFVGKPFTAGELDATVQDALRRASIRRSSPDGC